MKNYKLGSHGSVGPVGHLIEVLGHGTEPQIASNALPVVCELLPTSFDTLPPACDCNKHFKSALRSYIMQVYLHIHNSHLAALMHNLCAVKCGHAF